MIKLILFDWGDVCGLYNLDIFNTFLKSNGYNSTLVKLYFKDYKAQFDRDQLTEEIFWKGLGEKIGFKCNWRVLAERNKKNLKLNQPLLNYIEKLKKNMKVALLSNMDKTSITTIKEKVELSRFFDKVYFSAELKSGKLDKKVINIISKDFKVNTEEMLFIDDFYGNIEMANNLGMKTILFTNLTNLKLQIAKLFKN